MTSYLDYRHWCVLPNSMLPETVWFFGLTGAVCSFFRFSSTWLTAVQDSRDMVLNVPLTLFWLLVDIDNVITCIECLNLRILIWLVLFCNETIKWTEGFLFFYDNVNRTVWWWFDIRISMSIRYRYDILKISRYRYRY